MPRLAVLTLLFACSLSAPAFAAIYKWVDAQGVTHYSEAPPPSQDAQEVKTAPAPAPSDGARKKEKSTQDLELDFRKRRVEAAERDKHEGDAQRRETALRRERCLDARNELEIVQTGVPVYSINAKGEREYLPDASRPASIARLQKIIEQSCD